MAQLEVDEMLCLVRHEAAKIAPDDAMPCGAFPRVKLAFHISALARSPQQAPRSRIALTSFLMYCAMSYCFRLISSLGRVQSVEHPYLFDIEFDHGFLRYCSSYQHTSR